MRWLLTLALIASTTVGMAAEKDSRVISISNGSGHATAFMMLINDEYYVCTTKHVPLQGNAIKLRITGQSVECPVVYTTPESDGPVLCKASNQQLLRDNKVAAFKLAPKVPNENDVVYTIGFAGDGNFTRQEGKISGGGWHNVFSNRVSPGQSGSPLLYEDGVIGVVFAVSSDIQNIKSYASTYSSMVAAVNSVGGVVNPSPAKIRGRVVFFTAPEWCDPCQRMESEIHENDFRSRGLELVRISDTHPEYAKYSQAYKEKTGQSVRFPTLWLENTSHHQVGYQKRTSVLGFLLNGVKNFAHFLLGYPEEDHIPKPPAQQAPPNGGMEGEISTDPPPVPAEEGESVTPPDVDSVAWDDVTIVVVVARTSDATPVGDIAKRKALEILQTKLRKVNEDHLDGKAQIEVVSERIAPDRFDAVVVASGMVPEPIALVVMVKEKSLGLKSLIAGTVERKIMAKIPESTKFEIIFERINSSYEQMQIALLTPVAERYAKSPDIPDIKPDDMTDEQYEALKADMKAQQSETGSKLDNVMAAVAALKETKDENGEEKSLPARIIATVMAFLGFEKLTGLSKISLAKLAVKRLLGRFDNDSTT